MNYYGARGGLLMESGAEDVMGRKELVETVGVIRPAVELEAQGLRTAIAKTKHAPKAHSFDASPRVRARMPLELKQQLVAFYEKHRATETRPNGITQADCARLLGLDKSQFNLLLKSLREGASPRQLGVASRMSRRKAQARKPDGKLDGKAAKKSMRTATVIDVVVPRGGDRVVIVLPDGSQYSGQFLDAVRDAGLALRKRKLR